MRTTKLIKLRVRGNTRSICGRSSAKLARSTSTKPTSSAPAFRHKSRSDPASSGLATASDSVGLAEKTPTVGFSLPRIFDGTLEVAFSVIGVCIYTLWLKKNLPGLLLFQFRSDLLQISDHAGPTFSAQDRNHFILSRAPRRNRLSQRCPPLLSNGKFHMATSAAAMGLNQTFALQGPKVAHQRRAFHTQPFTQFRHAPSVFSLQGPQNRRLCGSNTKAANFRVKEPRHRPRNPAQVETHAILHRRHIQFLRHDVYIHTW